MTIPRMKTEPSKTMSRAEFTLEKSKTGTHKLNRAVKHQNKDTCIQTKNPTV